MHQYLKHTLSAIRHGEIEAERAKKDLMDRWRQRGSLKLQTVETST